MSKLIVISSSVAQAPGNGGLAWLALQFLLGFRRLGFDVLFLDRLEPDTCVDAHGQPAPPESCVNLPWLSEVLGSFELADNYALFLNGGDTVLGRTRAEVLDEMRRATCLINVMGFCTDKTALAAVRRRVFLDIDPGFGQMWCELGLHDPFQGHTDFVTLGRNIGRDGCRIPLCDKRWVTMPQPVVLEQWPKADGEGSGFTGIGAWRGPNAPIEYRGEKYGLRAHEFRQFAELPRRRPQTRFEIALDIHPDDAADRTLLTSNGWSIVSPRAVAGTPDDYRRYIVTSRAELMIPKQMYVKTNSGLLSDRSVYYLASGRPVLARDTGLSGLYPVGEGLITFKTLDEAVAGVDAIESDYARHSTAARRLAEAYFDSDIVLSQLLRDLQIV